MLELRNDLCVDFEWRKRVIDTLEKALNVIILPAATDVSQDDKE